MAFLLSSSSSSKPQLPFAFLFSILFLFSFNFFSANGIEFLVGDGEDGWSVPKPKEADRYNKWASHNRFNVDDTVRFKYEKDSVMVVTEAEYKQCFSAKPLFFDNNGNTVVKLDRPGLFYFMSGVSGHCQKGQKMIIKVLEPLSPPHPPSTAPPADHKNTAFSVSPPFLGIFFFFFLSFFFI